MIKAVLFDMDGVIVDTEPLHRKAYFQMFGQVGVPVTETLYESFTGKSTIQICRQLCTDFSLKESPELLVNLKRTAFKELFKYDDTLEMLPGVYELIKEYFREGLTLVLASSASMGTINFVFDRFKLDPFFKSKLSGAELKASKPHPEIFLNAVKNTGFSIDQCMVIEDSTNGIVAAKAAGIYCVAFKSPNSKNQDYTLADKVISSFDEISYPKLLSI